MRRTILGMQTEDYCQFMSATIAMHLCAVLTGKK
jgi:hypothetical protein